MKDKVIKDAMNSIENRISHVYNQGYNDGVNKGIKVGREFRKEYEDGLNDAWECARKIYKDLSIDKCIEIFEGKSWFDYTASEAMALINKYEKHIDSLILKNKEKCEKCVHKDDDFDCHKKSSDNKEDETYVYLYNGTFSKVKKGNSVILSTDITYWDRNIHDDKVLKAGEIHTLKEYFPETGACLITINNYTNKDRCKKCPNDHKCRLCLTGINWDQLEN